MEAKKILVVDDEFLTCQLIEKILKLQGFIAATLTDYRQLLGVVEDEKPDLLLMDYYLGSTHGLELLQSLREREESRAIPIIITSGMDRKKASLDAGADAFLLKPFDWEELIAAIKKLLDRSEYYEFESKIDQ